LPDPADPTLGPQGKRAFSPGVLLPKRPS